VIGVPAEHKLATACEERLGRVVDVASTFNLQRVTSPVGNFKPRKSLRVALALTESDLWLLELRYWAVGFDVGGVLCQIPRLGLVSQWRQRPWAWPDAWKAKLSWPQLATYATGSMIGGRDADRMLGLLTADEFDDVCAKTIADEGWSG
jgi:hypothetical protein